jgi:hypothetical protein
MATEGLSLNSSRIVIATRFLLRNSTKNLRGRQNIAADRKVGYILLQAARNFEKARRKKRDHKKGLRLRSNPPTSANEPFLDSKDVQRFMSHTPLFLVQGSLPITVFAPFSWPLPAARSGHWPRRGMDMDW